MAVPHPLVADFLGRLLRGDPQVVSVHPEDLVELQQQLLKLGSTPELVGAVVSVLQLATFVDVELQSPDVAAAIARATQATLPLLQAAGSGAETMARVAQAGEQFRRFNSEASSSPVGQGPAPAGSVRAGPLARFLIDDKKKF